MSRDIDFDAVNRAALQVYPELLLKWIPASAVVLPYQRRAELGP